MFLGIWRRRIWISQEEFTKIITCSTNLTALYNKINGLVYVFLTFKCIMTNKVNTLRNNRYLQIVGHNLPSSFSICETLQQEALLQGTHVAIQNFNICHQLLHKSTFRSETQTPVYFFPFMNTNIKELWWLNWMFLKVFQNQ